MLALLSCASIAVACRYRPPRAPCGDWCPSEDSNPGPAAYKAAALPTELHGLNLESKAPATRTVRAHHFALAEEWIINGPVSTPRFISSTISPKRPTDTEVAGPVQPSDDEQISSRTVTFSPLR